MRYPIRCPHCTVVVDSMDSVADSQAELDDHIKRKHPEVSK